MPGPGREQRRYPRRRLEVDIVVGSRHTGGECFFESANLSEGGAFLVSGLLLAVGEVILLTFSIPGTQVIVQTRARVAWVNRSPDENDPTSRPGMGIEFLDLSDHELAALSDHLARL